MSAHISNDAESEQFVMAPVAEKGRGLAGNGDQKPGKGDLRAWIGLAATAIKIMFGYAFRPFFLLVGAYAIVMIPAWGLFLAGTVPWPDALPAQLRHGHEMVFGFAGGAIAGFLLTAVATWTGRPPIQGGTLMLLCTVWLSARLGGLLPGPSGGMLWSGASLLFWVALLGLMARELIAAGNRRNYKIVPLLSGFFLAEAIFFLTPSGRVEVQEAALRTGLFLVLGMISLVGGRIIPAFSQNWLRVKRPDIDVQLPPFDRLDLGVVLTLVLFACAFILWPGARLTGWLGLIAAAAHAVRLLRWRGWLTCTEPLLWVLHVGYAWIPVGFALLGVAALHRPDMLDRGLHALAYGAIGTLILGVAARVALGHTGRPLQSSPAMGLAFLLISLGTVCRIASQAGSAWLWLSVALWAASYGLFLFTYAPILLRPRLKAG